MARARLRSRIIIDAQWSRYALHPSGDRRPTSVLVRDRLQHGSDTITQRVGESVDGSAGERRRSRGSGYGRWDEDRDRDHQDEYGDRDIGYCFLRKADRLSFRGASYGKFPERRIRMKVATEQDRRRCASRVLPLPDTFLSFPDTGYDGRLATDGTRLFVHRGRQTFIAGVQVQNSRSWMTLRIASCFFVRPIPCRAITF